MPDYKQAERLISVDTPAGGDVLKLQGFGGVEGISRIFRYNLDMLAEVDANVDVKSLIGQKVTINLMTADGGKRPINGCISRMGMVSRDVRFKVYRAEIVPWLWKLTRCSDYRIFQDKKVTDIIKQVFDDLGFHDYRFDTTGTYDERVYCVQYGETSFDFVSRLMEEEGIFYYFEHDAKKHTLVMLDNLSSYKDCPHQSSARYAQAVQGAEFDEDVIDSFSMEQEFRPGKFTHTDYNFEQSSVDLHATTTGKDVGGSTKFEIYEYPGEYLERAAGDKLAKIRLDELDCEQAVYSGSGNCRGLAAGYKFSVKEHPEGSLNEKYLLTEVQSVASIGSYYTGGDEDAQENYNCQFSCIQSSVQFRPRRVTPKPSARIQSAVVVGQKGEEIWPDKYGRIKVQFPWDRKGSKDDKSSCWIRVCHAWAGHEWGAICIPRIGQEVLVDFINGDPDQPIIVGRVYNDKQMPPWPLPDNKQYSGMRSRSTQHGGTHDANVISFYDEKDKEVIYVRAQKDMARRVEHDCDLKVGNDQTIEIKNNRTENVKQGNEKVTIEQGNRDVEISMGNETLVVKMGDQTTHVNLGKSHLDAMQSIELVCCASSIKLEPAMITIKAPMVKIEADALCQAQSSGMMIIKGSMTLIN